MKQLLFVIFLFFLLPLQSKNQEKMCLPLNGTFEEEKRQMIFFDLDGTLCAPHLHYLEIFASSLSEILEAESLHTETLYNAWNHALREEGAMTCSSVLESALKSLQVTNSFDCVSLACLLNEAYIPGVHLQEGAVELLKQLKDSGCFIGIITNGPFDTQMGVIKNLGLDELVHYI